MVSTSRLPKALSYCVSFGFLSVMYTVGGETGRKKDRREGGRRASGGRQQAAGSEDGAAEGEQARRYP